MFQLNSRDKANSFERFRRELRNPEIITYDELLERARYIIEENVTPVPENEEGDYDLPF